MAILKLTTVIKAPRARCFDLARSIDLHKVSTPGSNEKAIAGITSGLIGLNEEVTWEATHFGIRQQLSSRITGYEFPVYFRDEMVRGAFRKIQHDHRFEAQGEITLMHDWFEFESPLGILGVIADWLIIKNYLKKLIVKRNLVIKDYAESTKWKQILNAND